MNNKWIHVQDSEYNGMAVHEVKCPVCKHRETYHADRFPKKCLLCETVMDGVIYQSKEDPIT